MLMQRGDHEEVPWVQRDSSAAYQLLVAARQGRAPQRPVERLALLQLLMQLHRQSHERTGAASEPLLSIVQQPRFLDFAQKGISLKRLALLQRPMHQHPATAARRCILISWLPTGQVSGGPFLWMPWGVCALW